MNNTVNTIKCVENNSEKAGAIALSWKHFRKAQDLGFYFECLWILYGFAEDRTSALLYHAGLTSEQKRRNVTVSKRIRSQVRSMLSMNPAENRYGFDSFGGKLLAIEKLTAWSIEQEKELTDYQKAVKKAFRHLSDNESFPASVEYLNTTWRDMRNQLTHALMNKDPQAAQASVRELVNDGYTAVRCIDNAAKYLRSKGIREKFRIK